MFEDEGEVSYPDSDLVTDFREGGPEESVSELVKLKDGVGSMGEMQQGNPCPSTLAKKWDV